MKVKNKQTRTKSPRFSRQGSKSLFTARLPASLNKTIAVIGMGYVGLPLALLASKKGYKVIGIDINTKKVNLINEGLSPFANREIEKELKLTDLGATTDFSKIKSASIVIVCVPTPVHKNRLPDYTPIKSACKSIAPFISKGKLIILESTVNPGVCEEIVLPILEKGSGLVPGRDFYLAHCPERINPGDKKWNVANIARVVGGFNQISLTKALRFYRFLINAPIKPMGSLKEAEAVKIVENSFRNVNMAFVNELAQSFSMLGIDVDNVLEGAATKPFGFMRFYPSRGIGGHCIPVDPYYLIDYAKKNGYKHEFLSLACKINEEMPSYTVDQVIAGLKEKNLPIQGTKVAVLGLTYKAGIDDCRESPAFEIVRELKQRKTKVTTFDPYVNGESDTKSLKEALVGAKAIVVATDHPEFKKLNPRKLHKLGIKVVVDGMNCLPKEKFTQNGFFYRGIGR